MATDRVLIFAEAPAAGRVRARLTPPLPPDEAARVHEACLHDVVHTAARERGRIEILYEDAARAGSYFDDWFPHLHRTPQPAGDPGERMRTAFERAIADGARRLIALGVRSPMLPERVLGAAFDALREADAVIGPARDGAVYLIGIRSAAWPRAETLFRDVRWKTRRVLRSALRRAARAGVEVRVLPGCYAIDRIADLRRAREDAAPDSNLGRWLAGPEARHYIGA